jgi:RsiW-degrading membrane proteinase PrsW (M82 family)
MSSSVAERRARFRNGLGGSPDPNASWARRIFGNPWLWVCIGSTIVFAVLLWLMWDMSLPTDPAQRNDPTIMAMLTEALRKSFWWALPTLVAWILIFRFVDRYRRAPFAIWYLALGWGISVSTYIAIQVNTWAAQEMAVQGNGDPATAAGPAIFVAPFVEEFTKATVLFLLAIFARNRLVSRLQVISLAGLSAAGFAFTENILYYIRAFLYATTHANTGADAEAATLQTVWLRGFYTAFGHPLFTMMTAVGLVTGLRSKSRIVRVVAPLTGYLTAALLHMSFNGTVTVASDDQQQRLYLLVALPLVLAAAVTILFATIEQGRLIRARLTDYVRMGWLRPYDPIATGRLRSRFRALLLALWRNGPTVVATVKLQRRLTELAYLRDSMTRGLVDHLGATREEELLWDVRAVRPNAIDNPAETRFRWGWTRPRKPKFEPPTSYPGAAGLGGSWPAPGDRAAPQASPPNYAPPGGRPIGS